VQRLCQVVAPSAVAPAWHTRALLCVLLLAPITGLLTGAEAQGFSQAGRAASYLPLLLVNVAFAAYVTRVGLGNSKLRELWGGRFADPGHAFGEAALGLLLAAAVVGIDRAWQVLSGSPESLTRHALLPSDAGARLLWLVIAVSAGFSEELLYRGYLQRQLGAMTGRAERGVLLQALLFGIAHGQQGPSTTLRATIYGLIFGSVARRRRGLFAVVVAHSLVDLYGGWSG